MRFRKRLGAAILAIVMTVSSVQAPNGVSYAAEAGTDAITTAEILQEDKETSEGGTESAAEKDSVSDGEEWPDESAAPAEDETQPDESAPTDNDNRTDKDTGETTAEESITDETAVDETMTEPDTEKQTTTEETATGETTIEETTVEETTTEEKTEEETANEEATANEAKQDVEKYDQDNLDQRYTALDGTKLSSKADGKPKVLIFYFNENDCSQNTIQSIRDNISNFASADIYAIESNKGTKDSVSEFQKSYGCDSIVFAYDETGDSNHPGMSAYALAIGIPDQTEVTLPVICYIDANNRFQLLTQGESSAEDVLANLQEYCSYDNTYETYTITYELDGGTNNKSNPSTYTSQTDTIKLEPASKDGYTFNGWFQDAEHTKQVTRIAKGSTGNITLYARWKKNGYDLANLSQTYTALDGTKLTSKASKKPKLLIFYSFKSSMFTKSLLKAISERINDFDGVDTYAIEIGQATKDEVSTVKNDYGCDKILFAYDEKTNTNETNLWAYVRAVGIGTSLISPPIICYIDTDNRLQLLTLGNITVDDILSNLQKYCRYSLDGEEIYKIKYELNGGTNNDANPDIYTAKTETIVLKDPVRNDAEFDGWYRDSKYLEKVTEIAKGSVGDITLYAKWKVKGYQLPNLDQTYTSVDGTMLSSRADGKPKVLIFYFNNNTASRNTIKSISDCIGDFDGADIYAIECNKGTKNSVIEFQKKYGCDKILFAYDETGDINHPGMSAYAAALGIPDGTTVTLPVICYIDQNNCFQLMTQKESSAEDVLNNLQEYCGYTVSTGVYKIIYELDGGINNSANPSFYTSTDTVTLKAPYKKGFVFDGWYTDKTFHDEVLGIGKGCVGDVTFYAKWIAKVDSDAEITITFLDNSFVYNGKTQKPKVKVTTAGSNGKDIVLVEGTDYTLSYKNNKNAGTATVIVKGKGKYTGSVEEPFIIEPAPLEIRAADMIILIGDKIPEEYEYKVDGLLGSDKLIKEPILTCEIADTTQYGEYTVTPSDADAGGNYAITYEDGLLVVAKEYIYWRVTFDTQGHSEAPAACTGIRTGDTIEPPAKPTADGYRFDGWYKDSECTKPWDFETDIVEADITLYAKWLCVSSDGNLALQEIPNYYYTGKAIKPTVSVYDDDTLLKAGRDYQLKYYNNTNTNAGGVQKTGNGEGTNFNVNLPYVEIIGKGNYKDTIKVNFNILKVSIGKGDTVPAAGAVLKVNDHLTKSNKSMKPSVSLRLGRTLQQNKDFTLSLEPVSVRNASGAPVLDLAKAEIPANHTGEFNLIIRGTGNYEGSIVKTIYVMDKDHLMKNAKITLGKNLKNVNYTGKPITLKGSKKEGKNVFTVQIGKKTLDPATDYYVIPYDGGAGKADLVVVGKGNYAGRQTAIFNVKGWAFSNATVSISGISDKTYTGKAWTQNNDAVVTYTYEGSTQTLVYGADYTISYSRNINKGTATMTFIGNPKEGYTGSVKKTFKISAADIADTSQVIRDPSMGSITVSYAKSGARPADEIILTNKEGIRLRNGKDYTLKYKNNNTVTASAVVTVTGKGNYSGTFDVSYRIVKADLSEDRIVVQPVAVAYNERKAEDFAYTPAIRLKDGKSALTAGKDYNIEYLKNTQADYRKYLEKLAAGSAKDEDIPRARITAKDNSNYGLRSDLAAIEVPLQIYQTKFKKTDLSVQIKDAVYTGRQVMPEVTVSYNGKELKQGVDYMLVYGANITAGKNKGSVIISGLAPYYGGSVTYKFDITGRDLKYTHG